MHPIKLHVALDELAASAHTAHTALYHADPLGAAQSLEQRLRAISSGLGLVIDRSVAEVSQEELGRRATSEGTECYRAVARERLSELKTMFAAELENAKQGQNNALSKAAAVTLQLIQAETAEAAECNTARRMRSQQETLKALLALRDQMQDDFSTTEAKLGRIPSLNPYLQEERHRSLPAEAN
jgi:hypothetical protein